MSERLIPETMVLDCPKCPRSAIVRRRRRTTYRRVTDWTMGIARYRCDECGFEHPFTAEWVRDVSECVSPT